MPATATITSYYSFTANTKARASQVTNNFDVWRGHHIPVDPNTQTSANITYDLGSEEWRWRTLYSREVDFQSSTLGASLKIKGDTSYTAGAFVFEAEGVECFRVNSSILVTTTATKGNFAYSSAINTALVTAPASDTTVSGSVISITTIGRPVEVGLVGGLLTARAGTDPKDFAYGLTVYANNSATGAGVTIGLALNLTTATVQDLYVPPSIFKSFLFLSAGTYTLDLRIRSAGSCLAQLSNIRFYAKEV